MPSNAFPRQAQGLTFPIVHIGEVTPAFESGGCSQHVVDASENVI
jgi:hypothetical protein